MANYPLDYQGSRIDALLEKIDRLGPATDQAAGTMSAADKGKLNGMEAGAQANVIEKVKINGTELTPASKAVNITVDSEPTSSSPNPVSSGGVKAAIANFITNSVNDLVNYYLKSETYTKAEVQALIGAINQFHYEVYPDLEDITTPASNVLYLIGPVGTGTDKYEEYVWPNAQQGFVLIGTTSIDLSGYVTTTALNTALANYTTTADLTTLLGGKADKDADAVEGNLAQFDANGNPVDSGVPASKIGEIDEHVKVLRNHDGIAEGIADTLSAGTAQQFTFRKSGGDGVNYMRRIKGKTLVWNQLVGAEDTEVTVPSGHVYVSVIGGTVARATSDGTPVAVTGGTDTIFDLTRMFGAGNEPATADAFFALFPDAPTAYNPGELISNDAAQVETVGFNQWDEEWELGYWNINNGTPVSSTTVIRTKNFIPVICGQTYYLRGVAGNGITFYDADKNYLPIAAIYPSNSTFVIPENVSYIKISFGTSYGTTYNHDVCVNLSNPAKNGTYEPYWKRVLPLGLNSFRVTDGTNIITVNGLKSAGSSYDEIDQVRKKYIKRIGEVDLGTLDWNGAESGGIYRWNSGGILNKKIGYFNLLCSLYETNIKAIDRGQEKTICGAQDTVYIYVTDSAYTDAASFKAAMSGVILYYELATPVEYDLVDDIPNAILVDALGTEQAIFPEHQDGTPSAPFCCDSNYSISVKNLVAALASLSQSAGTNSTRMLLSKSAPQVEPEQEETSEETKEVNPTDETPLEK